MIEDNWTFYIINPFDENFEESTQNEYNLKYNESLEKLFNELLIPDPINLLNNEFKFLHYIDCNKENNIINKDDSYGYKFLKSRFFETK
jgi:hypothetical protein